jgi:pSer/pThr/pTyr-binding forkhead associated (FHA) protein
MAVRLRYLAHDLEVPMGQFLIGRTPECQLSLDDPLVSRRHAILMIEADGVFVQDLGSRNGVFVNGARAELRTRVSEGDVIRIGTQELVLSGIGEVASIPKPALRKFDVTSTMQDVRVVDLMEDNDPPTSVTPRRPTTDPGRRVHGLSLIGGVADKALQLGRADEAERLLTRSLQDAMAKAKAGGIPPEHAEKAALYALRLAAGTTRGSWIDYVFELYTVLRAPLPGRIVDELYAVVRKVKHGDLSVLRGYTACLREISHGFGPAERFIQQRIEGLERLLLR